MHRHTTRFLVPLALALASASSLATGTTTVASFEGAIGVDPLTAAGGVDALNTVRGINPGGRAWVLRRLGATVTSDGLIVARGKGLLLSSGESIATRGAVTHVAATLTCGPADATATRYNSAPFALDVQGDFTIRGPLSSDGVNTAVLPDVCANPVLFIRAANPTTGVLGGWFAVGIPSDGKD